MGARYLARSLAVAVMAATSLAANPAEAVSGLTVKVATISAGKLVIVGTALTAGTVVKIDGTTLSTIADAQKTFRFDVNYRTPDCRVVLATLTGKVNILISECGPAGVVPRGAWASNLQYVLN